MLGVEAGRGWWCTFHRCWFQQRCFGLAGSMIIQHAADVRVSANRAIIYFVLTNIENGVGLQYEKISPEALSVLQGEISVGARA